MKFDRRINVHRDRVLHYMKLIFFQEPKRKETKKMRIKIRIQYTIFMSQGFIVRENNEKNYIMPDVCFVFVPNMRNRYFDQLSYSYRAIEIIKIARVCQTPPGKSVVPSQNGSGIITIAIFF